jgi:tripartite-type tricarboxylate transporter receptor subunit TctC
VEVLSLDHSPLIGSPSRVSGVLLQNVTGANFPLVPYRGAGQVMTDMVAGQIDLSMFPATVALQQMRAGNARAYAVTSKTRIFRLSAGPV